MVRRRVRRFAAAGGLISLLAISAALDRSSPGSAPPSPVSPPARGEAAGGRGADGVRSFAVPVLMYHRICDLDDHGRRSPLLRDLTVSPQEFDRQMQFLVDRGFTLLLASQVETAVREGTPLPARAVAVTMDDGYRDNFENAFPVLRRLGLPATIFIVTGSVGRPERLEWDHILTMRRGGLGYGSHTVTHPDLTLLPLERLDFELRESRAALEAHLMERVTALAYPSGRFDSRVVEQARRAGYTAGWDKGGGPVRPGAELFELPRVRVRGSTTLADFERKIMSGVYAMAGADQSRGRQRPGPVHGARRWRRA